MPGSKIGEFEGVDGEIVACTECARFPDPLIHFAALTPRRMTVFLGHIIDRARAVRSAGVEIMTALFVPESPRGEAERESQKCAHLIRLRVGTVRLLRS